MEGIYDNLQQLPTGWERIKIGDEIEVIRGASPRPKGDPRYFGGSIPWIMISDVTKENGKVISKTRDHVTEEGAGKSRYLKAGTLILSNSATVCVPKILGVDGCIHDGFVAFPNLPKRFDILYLYYFFEFIRPRVIDAHRQGITQVNLNTAIVKNIQVPIAPPNEQKRIVAEIEKQFSRLDEAVANLKRVKSNLKRYKAAVLKAAVEGKLTEDWRQAHPDVEPASELLKRILAERRPRWNGKGKYKDHPVPNTANFPELPRGWCWITLESISEGLGGFAFESRKFSTSGYQVLKMANIRMGQIDISQKPSYIEDVDPETVSKYELKDGDLVVTLTGTRKKRDYGYIAVVRNLKRLLLNQRIARLRPFTGVLPEYLLISMQSDMYRNRFFASETGNVGQGNVGMTAVTKEAVALAPMAEQEQIVAEVERQLSVIDETDAIIAAALQRATRLRQSILDKAFTGRLSV